MKPLSMRHFILIKRRRRLNGQSSIPLLKEILNRNSGGPPGFKAAFLKQKTHFACYQIYSFPARYTNTSSLPFLRAGHEEEKQALSFACRRAHTGAATAVPPFLNDTKSSFAEPAARRLGIFLRRDVAGKRRCSPISFHQKRRLSVKPGKAARPLLKRKIKAGKRRPCPGGTWRSGASAGRRRPRPPSQDPERPFSRWKPSFPPRPSGPLHGRP